ncbi:MAG TPA: hypothetical protein VFW21_12505 [Mycobacterium sp.]|nr:hypothetical protein [Mycobacterium sp.]
MANSQSPNDQPLEQAKKVMGAAVKTWMWVTGTAGAIVIALLVAWLRSSPDSPIYDHGCAQHWHWVEQSQLCVPD